MFTALPQHAAAIMNRALPCPVAQQHVAPRKVASVAGAAVGAGEAVGQAGAGH